MDLGMLFQGVTNKETRLSIKSSIEKIGYIIPSIKSLYKNLKFLSLGAKVLKELVVEKSIWTSLYKELLSHWKALKDTIVEVAKGGFRYTKALSAKAY
jgi:hypothetical protein